MGTYTDLSVSGYPIVESKGDVVPELMTMFRERDRAEIKLRGPEWPPMIWGPPDPDCGDATATVYRCSASDAIDRLNVIGFTMKRVKDDFERIRESELERLKELAAEEGSFWKEQAKLFKQLSFKAYSRAFKQVLTKRIRVWPFEQDPGAKMTTIVRYICEQHFEYHFEYHFGFLSDDPRSLVRLACELSPPTAIVMQDVSGLIAAGYYRDDEPICDHNREQLVERYPENSSRIVLTEGSSDAAVLRDALKVLYPHLADFFSFLDFESSRSPGGAGQLVAMTKAFAAAGVTNRVIALFDNDTAAREARRGLNEGGLPPNFVVMNYPNLALLESYPTVGPSGRSTLNVNGLAAGLELYGGVDALSDGLGDLLPVQWRGFSEALGQYHGEVLHKNEIQRRLRAKLADCINDRTRISAYDWTGLRAILEVVFTAFD